MSNLSPEAFCFYGLVVCIPMFFVLFAIFISLFSKGRM
ncbi:hypothetical protein IC5_05613 [Bacillus cereus AND1407]|nr:hypothetical protein IC5_05613 [Bacillus cereus AND1407]